MRLRLSQLQTLEAVARHGSFSRAARELHLTQPAVSMQVRQLERELGLPLLERVGKRAFPTRAGELLLSPAARALGRGPRARRRDREPAGAGAGAGGVRALPRRAGRDRPARTALAAWPAGPGGGPAGRAPPPPRARGRAAPGG